eukprot:c18151_g1_i1 orf=266-766(+)
MVLLLLQIKADLENLTNLIPRGGSDGSPFWYFFKVKCGSCGEMSDKFSAVTATEQLQMPRSRGVAHLVQKCKFCGREGCIIMVDGRGKPYTIEDSEAGRFVPVMCFDCRGIEPVEFSLRDGWSAEGVSGSKFADIDLSEGEFAEYDEKASCPVGITDIEHKFVVAQ